MDDIDEKKHREFDTIMRPILEQWYKKKIRSSGTNQSGNNNFYQDVNSYLGHIYAVYKCLKEGMNAIEVWPTLPNVEQRVVQHFDSKHHKIQSSISGLQAPIQRATFILVIQSVHTIGEWIFRYDVQISNEVDVLCSSMRHQADDSTQLYKLDFNQIKKSFEQNELLELLNS